MKLAVRMRAMLELYLFDCISNEKVSDGLQHQEHILQASLEIDKIWYANRFPIG